ncbi:MAG: hypothetical protein WKF94_07265 [Solirubrobacteraceae bacterium]
MPAPRQLLVLVAAALTLLVAGCGDSGEGLLTSEQAASLTEKVDAAQQALDNDACIYAQKVALEGADRASKERDIDMALQSNIVDGFNQLAQQAESACTEEEEPEKTPTPEPTVTEVPTEAPTVEEVTPEPTVTEAPTEAVPTEEPTDEIPTPAPTDDTGGAAVPDVEEFDDG